MSTPLQFPSYLHLFTMYVTTESENLLLYEQIISLRRRVILKTPFRLWKQNISPCKMEEKNDGIPKRLILFLNYFTK